MCRSDNSSHLANRPLKVGSKLDSDAFHQVPHDLSVGSVVELCRPSVSMPGQVLNIFDGYALVNEVGNRWNAKRVGR